jgi:nucleoside-diphosphate-sugar epimerase
MVEGLLRLAEAEYDGPVNLGNPDEVTILDLAREVQTLAGSSSPLEFRPPMQDDPVRRRPDIALARRLLGWAPKVPRAEGLARTIEYYRTEESPR